MKWSELIEILEDRDNTLPIILAVLGIFNLILGVASSSPFSIAVGFVFTVISIHRYRKWRKKRRIEKGQ